MLRKFLFWTHLVVGISIGIVVFIMSATGVLLTYEAQIIDWDDSRHSVVVKEDQYILTTDEVLQLARKLHPNEHHIYIHRVNEKGRPIPVWIGPNRYLISPYSGEIIQIGQSAFIKTMDFIKALHRWLAVEGKQQAFAKEVTAYSNLLFLFLIITGVYLWLPKRINNTSLKSHLTFRRNFKNRHAKHYNWHHVLGIWTIIPLFIIVITATVFHFHWANEILYGAYSEEPPGPRQKRITVDLINGKQTYEKLFSVAKQHAVDNGANDWHSMWLEFGREVGNTRFYIDRTLGNNYDMAYALYLDNDTAEVVRVKRGSDWSNGDQAWGVVRFVHTGEYFGLIGQTIAGLSSLAACILVYTGFTLSWRRLIQPLKRKRKSQIIN